MNKKIKVVIPIRYYQPGFRGGGPMVSIINLVTILADSYDFYIITADRDFNNKNTYKNITKNKWIKSHNLSIFYIPSNIYKAIILFKQLKKTVTNQTVVYLNSLFMPLYSIAIVIASRLGILKIENLLVAPRNELNEYSLSFHGVKKNLFLIFARYTNLYKNVIWHASTEMECQEIIKVFNVNRNKIRVALNLTILPNTVSQEISEKDIEFSKCNRLKIIYLSRISPKKNLPYALRVLKKVKSNILFDIYGPIEDKDLWKVCLKLIDTMPSNVIVNYLGEVERTSVQQIFTRYDLFFFPTIAENFGHVIAESLSVGTPILISDRTPWQNLEEAGLGWNYSLDDPLVFVNVIDEFAGYSSSFRQQKRKSIVKTVSNYLNDPEIRNSNINLFTLPYH